jgi:hypothetical protein
MKAYDKRDFAVANVRRFLESGPDRAPQLRLQGRD